MVWCNNTLYGLTMKDNLANIPELNLDKTEHFYVVGTKNRNGIVAGNYKADLKKGTVSGNALINTISGMSETDKEALRQALGVSTQPNFNGWDYVDLGLPSGTLWSTCNVGASTPEEVGSYYAFGEVAPKEEYTDENHTNVDVVSPELGNDAARANMGGDWVLPTADALKELLQYTIRELVEINGVKGILFTSTINNETLFFVNAGDAENPPTPEDEWSWCRLWSSEAQSEGSDCAWYLYMCAYDDESAWGEASYYVDNGSSQYYGNQMRGVILGTSTPQESDLDKYYSALYPTIDVKWTWSENPSEGEIPLLWNNSVTNVTDILASQIDLIKLYLGHYQGLLLKGTDDSVSPGTIIPLYLVNKGLQRTYGQYPDGEYFRAYVDSFEVARSNNPNITYRASVQEPSSIVYNTWRPYLRYSFEELISSGMELQTAATYVEKDFFWSPIILIVDIDSNNDLKAYFWQPETD